MENRTGALQAVRHLIGLGHARIATIARPMHSAAALDRRAGYEQALVEASLTIRPDLIVHADFTHEGGRQAMRELLGLAVPSSAVFVASDTMAAGGLQAARELDVRVPEDVSVVSFDDLPIASLLVPPLTTVHQPLYDLGATAADLLVKRLERPDAVPQQVWLPTWLVIRESTAAPDVSRA